jgi:hypothetical protein
LRRGGARACRPAPPHEAPARALGPGSSQSSRLPKHARHLLFSFVSVVFEQLFPLPPYHTRRLLARARARAHGAGIAGFLPRPLARGHTLLQHVRTAHVTPRPPFCVPARRAPLAARTRAGSNDNNSTNMTGQHDPRFSTMPASAIAIALKEQDATPDQAAAITRNLRRSEGVARRATTQNKRLWKIGFAGLLGIVALLGAFMGGWVRGVPLCVSVFRGRDRGRVRGGLRSAT